MTYTHPGRNVPHYVYRCYDVEDRLLYVGCSFHPPTRLYGHEGTAWWWPQFSYVRNTVYKDRATALERERQAIFEERPRCNVKGRWYRGDDRLDWSAQDYIDLHHAAVQTANGIFGSVTSKLLTDIENEANERHGVVIPRSWAARRSA